MHPSAKSTGHSATRTLVALLFVLGLCKGPGLVAASLPYRHGSVMVKLKTTAKAGIVSKASLDPPPAHDQFSTLAVPEGMTPEEYINELEASGDVEYAEPNYLVRLLGYSSDPLVPLVPTPDRQAKVQGAGTGQPLLAPAPEARRDQYHLALTHALEAWATRVDASDAKVCIIDTGVEASHPDLEQNVSPDGFNAVDDSSDAGDDLGHGTLVAGIIGAVGNNSLLGAGVAWRVQLLSCKIFSNGSELADVQSAQRCLSWCIDQGAQVSSNSWGLLQASPPSRSLYEAVAAANAAGHITVFAAGNDGINLDVSGTKTYPASYSDLPNLISVASTDRQGQIAGIDGGPSRSNYGGRTVTIAAPGIDILSTALGDNVNVGSGTSFAAPQVAGALALLQAEAQALGLGLEPCQYKALLVDNSEKLPALEGKVQANGLLNVQAALEALAGGDIPACPPRPAPTEPPLPPSSLLPPPLPSTTPGPNLSPTAPGPSPQPSSSLPPGIPLQPSPPSVSGPSPSQPAVAPGPSPQPDLPSPSPPGTPLQPSPPTAPGPSPLQPAPTLGPSIQPDLSPPSPPGSPLQPSPPPAPGPSPLQPAPTLGPSIQPDLSPPSPPGTPLQPSPPPAPGPSPLQPAPAPGPLPQPTPSSAPEPASAQPSLAPRLTSPVPGSLPHPSHLMPGPPSLPPTPALGPSMPSSTSTTLDLSPSPDLSSAPAPFSQPSPAPGALSSPSPVLGSALQTGPSSAPAPFPQPSPSLAPVPAVQSTPAPGPLQQPTDSPASPTPSMLPGRIEPPFADAAAPLPTPAPSLVMDPSPGLSALPPSPADAPGVELAVPPQQTPPPADIARSPAGETVLREFRVGSGHLPRPAPRGRTRGRRLIHA